MTEAGYNVKQNKNAKSQVSECIKSLQTDSNLPIQRARMRVKVSIPLTDKERLKEKLLEGAEKVEHESTVEADWVVVRSFDAEQSSPYSDSDFVFRPYLSIRANSV